MSNYGGTLKGEQVLYEMFIKVIYCCSTHIYNHDTGDSFDSWPESANCQERSVELMLHCPHAM